MGMYEREYVQIGPRSRSGLGAIRSISVNTWIIIANVAVFALQFLGFVPYVSTPFGDMDALTALGHVSTYEAFQKFEVWRLVTFQFLHGGLVHLAMNMFGMWVFGGMVEDYLGRKRYFAFYLVCGIAGGLMYIVLNIAGAYLRLPVPGVLSIDPRAPLIGASAGVFGVIVACAFIAPHAIIDLAFPPVSLRLWIVAYGYVLIALISLLLGTSNAGGEAAHIGGAAAGYYFIRNAHHLRDFFDVFGDSRKLQAADGERELRIIEKVHSEGMARLTEEERAIVRRLNERLARRRTSSRSQADGGAPI